MMYSIEIRGAFDFLEAEVKIGTLEYERLRGNASFCFAARLDASLSEAESLTGAD